MTRRAQVPLISVAMLEPTKKLLRRARKTEILIGAERECDVVLEELPGISPRHAHLEWRNEALWVRDPGSEDGVFVGEAQVTNTPLEIPNPACIRLGTTVTLEIGVKTTLPRTYTYLFVYDSRDREFVKRYWVEGAPVDPTAVPPEADELDGRVSHRKAEATITRLQKKYPPPRYAVSRMLTGSWSFVERNFAGLYYH